MKAIRLSEEQYQTVLKRNAKTLSDWSPTPKPNKFHAEKTNGYDSKREAKRADELRLLEKSGAIANLREQVPFLLIEAQHYVKEDGTPGVEHACSYIADFTYLENGVLVVEDVKGYARGAVYSLYVVKRKLLLARHGVRVREMGRER